NYNIYIYINTIRHGTFLIPLLLFILFSQNTFGQNQSEIQLANEYLLKGDKKKAFELFKELSKSDANNIFIYNNYLNTMLDLAAYEEAHNYLKRLLRKDPENIQYQLDDGLILVRSGELPKADKYFRDLIAQN